MKDWRHIPLRQLLRFKERSLGPPNECWPWPGHRQPNGYGAVTLRLTPGTRGFKVCWLVHRLSYSVRRGEIPAGMTIDHLCRNRACTNPDHLEPVTMAVNNIRGNSLSSQNLRKTACPRGHALAGENLIRDGHGRRCRECKNARRRTGRPTGTPGHLNRQPVAQTP